MNPKQFKPRFSEASIADAAPWLDAPGLIVQLKADGVWHEETVGATVIVGERMCNGSIFVFDLPIYAGQDLRREPLHFRLEAMRDYLATCGDARLREIPSGRGKAFLEAVLRDGGEGVVAKPRESLYGEEWLRVKRCQTFDCIIAAMNQGTGSVRVTLDGQDCGWVRAFNEFDRLKVGDLVEVSAQCRHASGKFRSAKLIRIRTDKMGVAI